jgi:L-amino acid N-acyltransferase YncA
MRKIADLLVDHAADTDLPDIAAIYGHHVLAGTGTFESAPPSIEEMGVRRNAGLAGGYTWLAARDATGVLGFAYYGPFRPRSAYHWTVEDSVYVRDDARGQGVGAALLTALLAEAEAAGFRQMFALIGDSANGQGLCPISAKIRIVERNQRVEPYWLRRPGGSAPWTPDGVPPLS